MNKTIYSPVILLFRSRLVGIEPRLRVGRSGGSNPGRGKLFFLLQIGSGDRPASDAYRGYFSGLKRPGCVVEHSPPSSFEVKNE